MTSLLWDPRQKGERTDQGKGASSTYRNIKKQAGHIRRLALPGEIIKAKPSFTLEAAVEVTRDQPYEGVCQVFVRTPPTHTHLGPLPLSPQAVLPPQLTLGTTPPTLS